MLSGGMRVPLTCITLAAAVSLHHILKVLILANKIIFRIRWSPVAIILTDLNSFVDIILKLIS